MGLNFDLPEWWKNKPITPLTVAMIRKAIAILRAKQIQPYDGNYWFIPAHWFGLFSKN